MLHHHLLRRTDAALRARTSPDAPDGDTPDDRAPDERAAETTHGPWTVHRAGLVDVNPIARLLQEHRPFIDLDGDGRPDELPDPEHAGPATRLVLSHGALEHGEAWFARDVDGVSAVAVWMPPDADLLAQDLHRVVSRELGVPAAPPAEPAHAPLRSIVGATARVVGLVRESDAERVLIMLADAGRAPAEGRGALLSDVLAPVATREAAEGRDVLAVTVDPAQVVDLEHLGFGEVASTPLGAASMWLGSLRAGRQAATATV